MQKICRLIIILLCSNIFALVDQNATQETVDLYSRLKSASGNYIFFGELLPYGVSKKIDTFQITGKYPVVFSCDYDCTADVKILKFNQFKHDIERHYLNGGIILLCWSMKNFVTGGTSKDVSGDIINAILPNGSKRDKYLKALDRFASDIKKTNVPIIFRPFVECDGGWFWWGNISCTDEQFVVLWRDLVTYLRDVKQVHNLIYVFNPQIHTSPTYKIGRFPGEDWVDCYGIDDYSNSNDIEYVMQSYRVTADSAMEDVKPFIITEGFRHLKDYQKSDFWTWYFNQILNDPKVSKASIVCTWSYPWGSCKGRSDEANFLEMSKNPKIKFLEKKKGIIINFKENI